MERDMSLDNLAEQQQQGSGSGSASATAAGPIVCNGCRQGLEETNDSVVVSFGDGLWHVDCRCAKCSSLVEHDTNLLLLADGSPVCENCSYVCSFCGNSISNEAIVTGDESYHADCFRCKSCNTRIEELVFAKTSQGIYCMTCHNERVARTRKHAESKRNRSLRRQHRDKDKDRDRDRDRERDRGHTRQDVTSSTTLVDGVSSASSRSYSTGNTNSSSTLPHSDSASSFPSGSLDPGSPYISGALSDTETPPLSSASVSAVASVHRGERERDKQAATGLPDPPVSLKKLRAKEGHAKDRSYDSLRPGVDGYGTLRSRSDPTNPHAQRPTSPSHATFDRERSAGQTYAHTTPHSTTHFRTNSSGAPPVPFKPSSSSSLDASNGLPATGTNPGLSISRSTSPASNLSTSPRSASPNTQLASPTVSHFPPSSPMMTTTTSAPPRSSSMENSHSHSGSLAAPKSNVSGNKAANRRSGFYGVMQLNSAPISPTTQEPSLSPLSGADGTPRSDEGSRDSYFVVPRSQSVDSGVDSSGNRRQMPASSESEDILDGGARSGARAFRPPADERLQLPGSGSGVASSSSSSSASSAELISRSDSAMHNSASFYDSDVLVFLEAVNDPNSLRRSSTAIFPAADPETPTSLTASHEKLAQPSLGASPTFGATLSPDMLTPTKRLSINGKAAATAGSESAEHTPKLLSSSRSGDEDELEMLSPLGRPTKRESRVNGLGLSTGGRSTRGISVGDEEDEGEEKAKEAVKRVRESIRRSRGGSMSNGSVAGVKTNSGMTLDVELVELLLKELEQTKNRMKDLQKNYNAIRRASRQAFEGFSMAREEYDREVAARRDAEFEMIRLKDQMKEQAAKLGALDELQKKQELLQRRSNDLRSSVVGIEKELSKMRVERDMTVAEMEELAGLPKLASEVTSAPERLSVALNTRLTSLKEDYRLDLESLTSERDALRQEVEELKQTKELFNDESNTLNKRNNELADETAEAQQKLDAIKAELALAQQTLASIRRERSATVPRAGSPNFKASTASTASSSHPSSQLSSSVASSHRLTPQTSTSGASSEDPHAAVVAQKVDTVYPQATVRKFKWGSKKGLERPLNASISKPPTALRPFQEIQMRQHSFQPTSILRPVRCEQCSDKMWGMGEQRCQACGIYCHTKCISSYHIQCNSATIVEDANEPSTLTMFGNDLVAQCLTENRLVPLVVSKCIETVEVSGLEHEGIYRKSGGMGQTKLISSFFDRGEPFDLQDQDRFNDISAVTSVLKNYFRNLPNPLFTFDAHQDFCNLPAIRDPDTRLAQLETLLHGLPEHHFATLKMLMLHLNRIHRASATNKMTPANLGVVFGPTLLRSADPSQEFSQMHLKARVVELTVENAPQLFAEPFQA